ncbi:hypothetical protein LEP1GSC060_2083 [Leptospira weilii serovar Ranarum str. ICFT]|uniref:Uncharacterized protein n=1 Tax=Leptospira weilii serovar Ranarum str. ICFT TaxID=1218598 RepID=N1WDU7_9LEPT|nr:hypothetical protein LEP1GSC060_2083 [Leptospira weilii serovar Ranarum str. ICFT]
MILSETIRLQIPNFTFVFSKSDSYRIGTPGQKIRKRRFFRRFIMRKCFNPIFGPIKRMRTFEYTKFLNISCNRFEIVTVGLLWKILKTGTSCR